jgi:hypothetical protein
MIECLKTYISTLKIYIMHKNKYINIAKSRKII